MKALACLLSLSGVLFAQPRRVEEFPTSAGTVKITPIRHASMMIEGGGRVIHVDPTSQGSYEGLPPADLILITDIHGDHMDPKMIARLKKEGTRVFGPEAVARSVAGAEIIRNGHSKAFDAWRIEAIPAYNLQRGPEPGKVFHEKGRGNGYVLTYGRKRFYISGDTEATPEMKALKNIDVAFVAMNLPYTMPPEEAAAGVRAFRPKVVYPYHYRGSDLSQLRKALEKTDIDVRIREWY
jgi:L-ascorbate metabolism protein UlaG (beta-lactamase superfamily)